MEKKNLIYKDSSGVKMVSLDRLSRPFPHLLVMEVG